MSEFAWEIDSPASKPSVKQIPPAELVSEEIQELPKIEAKAPEQPVPKMAWEQDELATTSLAPTSVEAPVQEESGPNFFERVGEDLTERKQQMAETTAQQQAGELPAREAILQRSGAMAGGVLDIIGEGLISAVSGAGTAASFLTPDDIENPVKEKLSEGWDTFVKTPVGQAGMKALSTSAEMYGMWKKDNPRAAKNIESVINVGLLFAPVKGKARKNAPPTRIGQASTVVSQAAERQKSVRRHDKLKDLILEKETPTVRKEHAMRTREEGLFKKQVIEPTKWEKAMITEVSKIPEVGKAYKSFQGNLNAVNKANDKINSRLQAVIDKEASSIPYQVSTKRIDDVVDELKEFSPTVTGNTGLTASRVADQALLEIGRQPPTAAGMLRARKAFDKWVEKEKGDKFLKGDKDTAMLQGVKAVRNEMNDMIATNIKTAKARVEWRRSTLLYDVAQRVAPKAAAEYNTIVGRMFQNAVQIIAPRNEIVQLIAGSLGLGGLGAAAAVAPFVRDAIIASAGVVGVYKAVTSVTAKKGVAKLLKLTDRAILTSENPAMIKQLRADKAALLEIMKSIEVTPEESQ